MSNAEWMTSLPEEVRNLPVINLAIPGTHNSMTYGINSGSKIAPDADTAARRIYRIFPCCVRRWARTQSVDVVEQLNLGVRYFDLRVCQKDDKFFFAHAVFAMEVFGVLEELKDFLDKHPDEMVILDFQHFYAMRIDHHMQMQQKLLDCFGSRLYSTKDGSLNECSLTRCKDLGRQLIIIYRRCPLQLHVDFWPSYSWPTPWPNVASITKLQSFLDDSLLSRRSTQGYVSQCILTPTGRYIAIRFFSSLKRTAKRVDKKLHPWIESQTPGSFHDHDRPKVNVFIADFVNLKDGRFCNWVISLNKKLDNNCDADIVNEKEI